MSQQTVVATFPIRTLGLALDLIILGAHSVHALVLVVGNRYTTRQFATGMATPLLVDMGRLGGFVPNVNPK